MNEFWKPKNGRIVKTVCDTARDRQESSATLGGSPESAEKSILSAITLLGDALVAHEMKQPGAAKVYINAARSYLNGAEALLFKNR